MMTTLVGFHANRNRKPKVDYTKIGLSPFDAALHALLSRPKIPMKWGSRDVELKPEQKECVDFFDALRTAKIEKRLKGIPLHIANEGKRNELVAIILKAMGMLSGATDYIFFGGGLPTHVLEMKAGKGQLTDNQLHFKAWCEAEGIAHAVCYSAEEGLTQLKVWGRLT